MHVHSPIHFKSSLIDFSQLIDVNVGLKNVILPCKENKGRKMSVHIQYTHFLEYFLSAVGWPCRCVAHECEQLVMGEWQAFDQIVTKVQNEDSTEIHSVTMIFCISAYTGSNLQCLYDFFFCPAKVGKIFNYSFIAFNLQDGTLRFMRPSWYIVQEHTWQITSFMPTNNLQRQISFMEDSTLI